MDNLKQAVSNVTDKVEEAFGGKSEEPKVEEQPVAQVTPVTQESIEDRSAYNCVPCKGEGIVNNVICATCNGTGKV